MILIDSNIPMYLVGAAHPNKEAARRGLEEADPAFDALLSIVDVVYPIERADVERARRLLHTTPSLSARDALHIAVMQGRDIGRILTFDTAFDGIPGIVRLG
jgi:hypothetical protein